MSCVCINTMFTTWINVVSIVEFCIVVSEPHLKNKNKTPCISFSFGEGWVLIEHDCRHRQIWRRLLQRQCCWGLTTTIFYSRLLQPAWELHLQAEWAWYNLLLIFFFCIFWFQYFANAMFLHSSSKCIL